MSGNYKETTQRNSQSFDYCKCRCNVPYDVAYGQFDKNSRSNHSNSFAQSLARTTTTHTTQGQGTSYADKELIDRFKSMYTSHNKTEGLDDLEDDKDSPVLSEDTDLTCNAENTIDTGDFLEGLHCSFCDKPILMYTNLDFKLFDNWINYVFYHKSKSTESQMATHAATSDTNNGSKGVYIESSKDLYSQEKHDEYYSENKNDSTDSTETPVSINNFGDGTFNDTLNTSPYQEYSEYAGLKGTSLDNDSVGAFTSRTVDPTYAQRSSGETHITDENCVSDDIRSIGDIMSSILMSSEETMFSIINNISPGEHCTNEKNQLFDSVKRFLQYCLGEDTIVHLTGSTAYDIDIDYSDGTGACCYSDLDIVLLTNAFGGDPRVILQKVYSELTNMQHVLKERNKCPIWVLADSNIKLVESAKVPIIIIETKNGLLCDISVNTLYPLLHTELFKSYIDEHPMVRPLMRIIKHWLLVRGLPTMKEGGFPSILWMSLFCNSLDTTPINASMSNLEYLTSKNTGNASRGFSFTNSGFSKHMDHLESLNYESRDESRVSKGNRNNYMSNALPTNTETNYNRDHQDSYNESNMDSHQDSHQGSNKGLSSDNEYETQDIVQYNYTQLTSSKNETTKRGVDSKQGKLKPAQTEEYELDSTNLTKNDTLNLQSCEVKKHGLVQTLKSNESVKSHEEYKEDEYEDYDDEEEEELSETFREVYNGYYSLYGCSIGKLWERLQGSHEEYGILCSLEKCFVNLSKGLTVMDIVNRFIHIKNGTDYGGMSLFCKNIIRLIEMEPNVPYGTWLVYYYELNRAKEYMTLYSKRLEMLVTLLAFLRLLCNETTTLEHFNHLSNSVYNSFGYDLSYFTSTGIKDDYSSLYINNQYNFDSLSLQSNLKDSNSQKEYKDGSNSGSNSNFEFSPYLGSTNSSNAPTRDISHDNIKDSKDFKDHREFKESYRDCLSKDIVSDSNVNSGGTANVNATCTSENTQNVLETQLLGVETKNKMSEFNKETQLELFDLINAYVNNISILLRIQLLNDDLVNNIKLLIYHMFQQFKSIPNEIFEKVQDNIYSIPVAIDPPTPIEEEPNEFGYRSFECSLWDDSGWYIVVLHDRLCIVKVIKICIEWEFWWSKDFVSRRDTRSIFHGFVYRQLRLDDIKKNSNYSSFSTFSVNSPSILIKRGSLVLFNPCDIVSKLHVLKVVKHEQYISPSLYSTDFYTGVKCLYVLPGFEVDRFICFEQISHKLKHYIEFRPQVTFCKLCGIVNMKKINSYTEYKIPQRKLRNAKYVLCNQKYNHIYNLMQYKHSL